MIITSMICRALFISCDSNSDIEKPTNDNSVVIETASIKVTSVENGNEDIATVKELKNLLM